MSTRPILSTYRLQLNEEFDFAAAEAMLPYLQSLGITHLYLSPILKAAPGSTHGYDVVDHDEISPVLGGREGLQRLAQAAHARDLGLIVDIVPNHMALPTPAWHNRALWAVLRDGPEAATAHWFDIDWSAGADALLLPVLGQRIDQVLADGELQLVHKSRHRSQHASLQAAEPTGPVLQYFDHLYPVRPGTESLPMAELLAAQHYRLAHWTIGDESLNYRRFFDVDSLVAIRVEEPEVFDATHGLILQLIDSGVVDGLRIDHPDGLADPEGYLARLAERCGNAWVSVEKILAPHEALPNHWACVGTTGYDAAWRILGCFVHAPGETALAASQQRLTGTPIDALPAIIEQAKIEVMDDSLRAEVARTTRLALSLCSGDIALQDHSADALQASLVALWVAADQYRYYCGPDRPMDTTQQAAFDACVMRARARLSPEFHDTLALLAELLSLSRQVDDPTRFALQRELVIRFQQTTGAVMAKGVEDTAFYRWTRLLALCEVGGAPEHFALSDTEWHRWAERAQQRHPQAQTALSTHDAKRSEDVRARMAVISECPERWARLLDTLHECSEPMRERCLDGAMEHVIWQTLAGTWGDEGPPAYERLRGYFQKAAREAKQHTSWARPDSDYEQAIEQLLRAALDEPALVLALQGWANSIRPAVRANVLGMKLMQLMAPGVADVYQGSEQTYYALVDPDNRQPVNAHQLAERLTMLDRHARVRANLDDEKHCLTASALRLRRACPEAFIGPSAGYHVLPGTTGHVLSFARTQSGRAEAIALVTRHSLVLQRLGGWGSHQVCLPEGRWHCTLSDSRWQGGTIALAELLNASPVALLQREP